MSQSATLSRPEPAVSAPSVEQQLQSLRHDLTAARARNRTLMRELTRAASAPSVVAVLVGPNREHDQIVFLSNGIRLEHRWTETEGWRYVQAETIPGTLASIVDGIFVDDATAPLQDGMAVIV